MVSDKLNEVGNMLKDMLNKVGGDADDCAILGWISIQVDVADTAEEGESTFPM